MRVEILHDFFHKLTYPIMATLTHFLDTRNSIDGNGIIKLRITHNRVQRDYSTKIKISPDDYLKIKNTKVDGRATPEIKKLHSLLHKRKNAKLNIVEDGFLVRAENIVNDLGVNFTFDKFKDLFDNYGKDKETKTLFIIQYVRAKSYQLKENKQFSHGEDFSSLATSLCRYVDYLFEEYPKKAKDFKKLKSSKIEISPKDEKPKTAEELQEAKRELQAKNDALYTLEFSHINKAFMSDWNDWMLVEGKAPRKAGNTPTGASITTVSIYARALRTAFNEAISNGLIEADTYPFGLRGFSIPSGKNIKKALPTKDLDLIKNYEPEPDSMEERSRDFWLFSYYANGINFKDLLSLRFKDWNETDIFFQRAKTAGKTKQSILIRIRVNPFIKMVIEKYGNKMNKPDDLIFPYLNSAKTLEERKKLIGYFVASNNKYMARIATKLNIKSNLGSYQARHTHATQLMRNNAPMQTIKDSLGHSDAVITAGYLGSFEKEAEDAYFDML